VVIRLTLQADEGNGMSTEDVSEMGPIDYLLVEWPGRQPNGEVAPTWSTSSTAA
jgi:hypothetical protein